MSDLGFILLFAGVALLAAWFVNFLVGLLRGEHPGDTGRVWWEVLTGMFATLELGWFARFLAYCTGSWPRRILTAVGGFVLLLLLFQACRGE